MVTLSAVFLRETRVHFGNAADKQKNSRLDRWAEVTLRLCEQTKRKNKTALEFVRAEVQTKQLKEAPAHTELLLIGRCC